MRHLRWRYRCAVAAFKIRKFKIRDLVIRSQGPQGYFLTMDLENAFHQIDRSCFLREIGRVSLEVL